MRADQVRHVIIDPAKVKRTVGSKILRIKRKLKKLEKKRPTMGWLTHEEAYALKIRKLEDRHQRKHKKRDLQRKAAEASSSDRNVKGWFG